MEKVSQDATVPHILEGPSVSDTGVSLPEVMFSVCSIFNTDQPLNEEKFFVLLKETGWSEERKKQFWEILETNFSPRIQKVHHPS